MPSLPPVTQRPRFDPDWNEDCVNCSTVTWCEHFHCCLAAQTPGGHMPDPSLRAGLEHLIEDWRRIVAAIDRADFNVRGIDAYDQCAEAVADLLRAQPPQECACSDPVNIRHGLTCALHMDARSEPDLGQIAYELRQLAAGTPALDKALTHLAEMIRIYTVHHAAPAQPPPAPRPQLDATAVLQALDVIGIHVLFGRTSEGALVAYHRNVRPAESRPAPPQGKQLESREQTLLEVQLVAYALLGFEPDQKFNCLPDAVDCVQGILEMARDAAPPAVEGTRPPDTEDR
jgi:hypothetical protein